MAVAPSKTTVVQLRVGSGGQLAYPDEHLVRVSASSAAGRTITREITAEVSGEADARARAEAEAAPAEASFAEPLDWEGLEKLDAEQRPEVELDPLQRSQVQIDFDARPDWVECPEGDVNGVHQICVTAGPYVNLRSARKELYQKLKVATDQYIDEIVGHPAASQWVRFSAAEIRRRLVSPQHYFDEKVVSPSFGPMYQTHALLEFTPAFHNEVERGWHEVMARTQLARVALVGGAVLGILLLLFGYFNADTATRGFYSRRLKFVTGVAILVLVAAGFLIARSIPWLWL